MANISFDPVKARIVAEEQCVTAAVQALRDGHTPERLREIARRLLEEKPEGDGWEITEKDLIACISRLEELDHTEDNTLEVVEVIRDRLRARVQPRRVGEAEWKWARDDERSISLLGESVARAIEDTCEELGR